MTVSESTIATIWSLLKSGADVHEISEAVGVCVPTIRSYAKRLGIKPARKPYGRNASARSAPTARTDGMRDLYLKGLTLEQIGKMYGVTRERVRQLLTKHYGINGRSGGQKLKTARRAESAIHAREKRIFAKYGCTLAQYKEVQKIGRDMIAAGISPHRIPLTAFGRQRQTAKERGIQWELTFWQWWSIWNDSGLWSKRGRGTGYVMCRYDDKGPYATWNVYIETAAHNTSTANRKKQSGLPIGVQKTPSGRYYATRRVNGEQLNLGTYETPEEAARAYQLCRRLPTARTLDDYRSRGFADGAAA